MKYFIKYQFLPIVLVYFWIFYYIPLVHYLLAYRLHPLNMVSYLVGRLIAPSLLFSTPKHFLACIYSVC